VSFSKKIKFKSGNDAIDLNIIFCTSSPYPIISFVNCVLNMLTRPSIRASVELRCLAVFNLSSNVLFCYFIFVLFVFYFILFLLPLMANKVVCDQ